jgi:hypothetical protein
MSVRIPAGGMGFLRPVRPDHFSERLAILTFPVKSEDSSEERCYAGVDLVIEMEWAHGFR